MHLDFGVAWKFLPILLQASLMTIALFVLSQVLGTAAAFFVALDRKSTRLNSSHLVISYAVFCLKKKNVHRQLEEPTNRPAALQPVAEPIAKRYSLACFHD